MKCDKCGDEQVFMPEGKDLRRVCLNCAFNGDNRDGWRSSDSDYKFEIFNLKVDPRSLDDETNRRFEKYRDKAREMRDEIWRKFSEDTSKYISNESPCDDSMRERPNDANTWDGKIYVLEGRNKISYEILSNIDKPKRDDMRCPKCHCTVNFMESNSGEITDSAMRWLGECDDCDAQIEFHFFRRTGFPGGYKPITFESGSFASGEITLYGAKEVDWDAALKELPRNSNEV